MSKEPKVETKKSIEGIPVELAFLHASVNMPGCFGEQTQLSHFKIPGIKLEMTPSLLIIKAKHAKGHTETGYVPMTNVKVAIAWKETV